MPKKVLLAATVIANLDCADVDAYDNFHGYGARKTKLFIENRSDLEVILIYVNESGELNEFGNKESPQTNDLRGIL